MNTQATESGNVPATFESSLELLQSAVTKLESGELTLDQSLQQFEDGVRLTRLCQDYLNTAEQKVDLLMKASASQPVELRPFPPSSSF